MPRLSEGLPSSPPSASASSEEALAYYKTQYEQLEAELADFQNSSRELEAELERDIEASEKRERQLKEKSEGLTYEVEEWKVSSTSVGIYASMLTFFRLSISKPNPSLARFRTACRKRSLRLETRIALCSLDCGTLKYKMTTLNDKRGTLSLRWRTWSLNTPLRLSAL